MGTTPPGCPPTGCVRVSSRRRSASPAGPQGAQYRRERPAIRALAFEQPPLQGVARHTLRKPAPEWADRAEPGAALELVRVDHLHEATNRGVVTQVASPMEGVANPLFREQVAQVVVLVRDCDLRVLVQDHPHQSGATPGHAHDEDRLRSVRRHTARHRLEAGMDTAVLRGMCHVVIRVRVEGRWHAGFFNPRLSACVARSVRRGGASQTVSRLGRRRPPLARADVLQLRDGLGWGTLRPCPRRSSSTSTPAPMTRSRSWLPPSRRTSSSLARPSSTGTPSSTHAWRTRSGWSSGSGCRRSPSIAGCRGRWPARRPNRSTRRRGYTATSWTSLRQPSPPATSTPSTG